MARIDSRRARRMMKSMGLNMEEFPDVKRVILQASDREIVVEEPAVTMIDVKGQKVFQVTGGRVSERSLREVAPTPMPEVPDEDVQLVAQQAGVSLDKARAALKESQGDLAKAILLLGTRS